MPAVVLGARRLRSQGAAGAPPSWDGIDRRLASVMQQHECASAEVQGCTEGKGMYPVAGHEGGPRMSLCLGAAAARAHPRARRASLSQQRAPTHRHDQGAHGAVSETYPPETPRTVVLSRCRVGDLPLSVPARLPSFPGVLLTPICDAAGLCARRGAPAESLPRNPCARLAPSPDRAGSRSRRPQLERRPLERRYSARRRQQQPWCARQRGGARCVRAQPCW